MEKLMLYIHIPFCKKKCNYCDFLSFYSDNETIKKYISKLIEEIEGKKHLANSYEISSIYIGGGTPSFIDGKYIRFIMESIKKSYKLSSDCEISIEINPNTASKDKIFEYKESGINRLSFGLQSANDNELKILGRIHTYKDFLDSYDTAIHYGFNNINIDIINGIPEQTTDTYKKTLKQVLMLNIKHISIYNLIIEKGTNFYESYKNNKLILPTEDVRNEFDNITKELTSYYHLSRYEISNYAKDGYICRHNYGYWSDVPYLGFGLNSSSYFETKRYKNICDIKKYLECDYNKYILKDNITEYYDEITSIDKLNHINEYVMLGFRKTVGINANDFHKRFNEVFNVLYKNQIMKYETLGYLINNNGNYYLTDLGLDIQNTILTDFLLENI